MRARRRTWRHPFAGSAATNEPARNARPLPLGRMSQIGMLNERSLHRQLKELVAERGDQLEVPLDGYVVDIVRGDRLIEVQTGPLGPLGAKLDALLDQHDVTIVHPIAVRRWLHSRDRAPRRSPTRRTIYNLFDDLVSLPTLIDHPGLSLHVVLIEEDTHRIHDPTLRRRRGGWRVVDRRLRAVIEHRVFATADDLVALVPDGLPDPFTTADLAEAAGIGRDVAQRMAYCLRALECFEPGTRVAAGVQYRIRPQAIAR